MVGLQRHAQSARHSNQDMARDHYYCLFDKRGHETVEWGNDEEVESHIQHML